MTKISFIGRYTHYGPNCFVGLNYFLFNYTYCVPLVVSNVIYLNISKFKQNCQNCWIKLKGFYFLLLFISFYIFLSLMHISVVDVCFNIFVLILLQWINFFVVIFLRFLLYIFLYKTKYELNVYVYCLLIHACLYCFYFILIFI